MKSKSELRRLAIQQKDLDNCPKCNISLIGEEIPEKDKRHFSSTHFRKEIGIEDPMVYDGVSWYMCPDCRHVWKRFPWSPEYSGGKDEPTT